MYTRFAFISIISIIDIKALSYIFKSKQLNYGYHHRLIPKHQGYKIKKCRHLTPKKLSKRVHYTHCPSLSHS